MFCGDTDILLWLGWIFGGILLALSILGNITALVAFMRRYTIGLVVSKKTATTKVKTEGKSLEQRLTILYPYVIAGLGIAVAFSYFR